MSVLKRCPSYKVSVMRDELTVFQLKELVFLRASTLSVDFALPP